MPVLKNFSRIAALVAVAAALVAATAVATAAPPTTGQHSISITASPATVTFSKPTTISGTFSGAETASQKIALEANEYPYTAGFKQVQKGTTNADGTYKF